MRALALDPGGTTGWCYIDVPLPNPEHAAMVVGEDKWSLKKMYDVLKHHLDHGGDHDETRLHVIYEDFSYRNASRAGLDLTPVKLIGIIELYREMYEPMVGFHKQSAATGKAFWSDDKLKARGLHAKGKKHARDATRHLMQWLSFGPGSQYCRVDDLYITMDTES